MNEYCRDCTDWYVGGEYSGSTCGDWYACGVQTVEVCDPDGDDLPPLGDGSGGGGSGYITSDPDPPMQDDDPCDNAKALAAKINEVLNYLGIKTHLDEFISNYKNSEVEHGFAIFKNADGSYSYTATSTGDGNHIEWNLDASLDIVALVHVHPPGMSAAPSVTDMYGLNDHRGDDDFVGSIVISGDDRYMVSVTDSARYSKFVSKKSEYYDVNTQSQWKDKSKILEAYQSFLNDYMHTPGYAGEDAVFPTQLYLMENFKVKGVKGTGLGMSLQKWDSAARAFSPVHIETTYNSSAGSSVTLGGGGQVLHSPYSSIKVEPGCD